MRIYGILLIIISIIWELYSQEIVSREQNGYKIKYRTALETIFHSRVNESSKLDFIHALDESKPGYPKVPSKLFYLAIPPESKVTAQIERKYVTELKNVVLELNPKVILHNDSILLYYEAESIIDNSVEVYPEKEIEIAGYTWVRDFYVVAIKVNTHRYFLDERRLEIIDSCEINVNYTQSDFDLQQNKLPLSFYDEMLKDIIINFDDALKFRTNNPGIISNSLQDSWIDYSKEYIKLAIPWDNIYRITYHDLVNFGLNPNQIDPRTFRLFLRGQEQPIFVAGELDGIFDTLDFIEFYAEKNYSYQNYHQIVSIGQDYINYMNRYNDTTIVWLTWGESLGKRVSLIQSEPVQTSDTISSHLVKIHLEQDVRMWYYDAVEPRVQLPFWQENKVWTWLTLGSGGYTSVNFFARDFLPGTPVHVIARLISYASSGTSNAHKHGLGLNTTTPQDTIIYNFKQTVNLTGTYNSSLINQGNNTVRIFGMPTQASFHQSLIDWVDVEYFRRNLAINDTLRIIIPDSVTTEERIIRIDNITDTSHIIIYKVQPQLKKVVNVRFTNTGPYSVLFIDTVNGNDEYFITTSSKVSQPVFKQKKYFVNLLNPSRGADYIIITNKLLQNSVNQYKNFITSSYNIRVEIIFDEDIYDEFSYGMIEAEAIKSFLIEAYWKWQAPKPSFLTLIGDANYDYKDIASPAPVPRKKNILTSFGNPVSDVWYVMWDTVNIHFPQMYVGRIPANNDQEVINYLQKHQIYLQRGYDIFNKSYLFFSGGNAQNPSELAQIKAANDFLINNYILGAPLFGNSTHFYKTMNPPSNFGPYTLEEVQHAIDEGGLFISYIGHSGTRTWDNSITEVEHLKNKYADRFSLITDFGCSTAKFAEPDVDAFGELFICQSQVGQAIAYLGNSSWGYVSTSLRFPKYFYQLLLFDSLKTIGRAHTLAKIRQINETGAGDVNRVFTYGNLLLGDPIIGFKVPEKPNFVLNEANVKILDNQPNDQMDSIRFEIILSNYGIVNGDSTEVLVQDFINDSLLYHQKLIIPFIRFKDTLEIYIPVKGVTGSRSLKILIDPVNYVDEIYENDNQVQLNYVVNSTSLLTLEPSNFYNTGKEFIKILNPFIKRNNSNESLILEISTTKDFINPRTYVKTLDTLLTRVEMINLMPQQRYFYRTRLDEPGAFWSETRSFTQKLNDYTIHINEIVNSTDFFEVHQVKYDTASKSWELSNESSSLRIQSAGAHDGSFGSIQWNGYEQLPNTFYWGLVTAVIDSITLKPTRIRYFLVPDPGVSDSLTNYINSLDPGTLLAMTISADAAQGVLGYSGNTPPRNAIKTLGSLYIDSIRYRESWCILGKKGAPIGTVPESYKKLFAGVAQIEITKNVTYDSGYVIFPEFKYANKWNHIKIESVRPENSLIIYLPLGIKSDGTVDTLHHFQTSLDSVDLSQIDAKLYPSIKLMAKLYANSLKESPKIYSISASYETLPELAMNYQTISINRDTITQGENIQYTAKIFNVGKSPSDTFRVLLELIKSDNTSYVLFDTVISRLNSYSFVNLNYNYINKIYDGHGDFVFKLSLDPDNTLREFYKTNNIFHKSFFVKKDTTTSVSETNVIVLFNGKEIRDWDYVEPSARIDIQINYPIWFPVNDTSAIQVFLDDLRINSNQFSYDYDTIERKINVRLETELQKGDHYLRIFLKDAFGRISSIPVYDRYFKVTSGMEILKVYNFPNPFNNGTYFTFILTQVPDELQIKVYTVTGRMIKNIKLSGAELSINFNKVFWDGRDEDGDLLGNGVYLYKIIANKGDKIETSIQKLAIVR